MGWWRRMRNKFKGKSSARPVRYVGHTQRDEPMDTYGRRPIGGGGGVGGAATTTTDNTGPRHNTLRVPTFGRGGGGGGPPRVSTEKALIEESRLSSSLFRPSMMSDRSAYMQEMSFELPRR